MYVRGHKHKYCTDVQRDRLYVDSFGTPIDGRVYRTVALSNSFVTGENTEMC